MCLPLIPLKQPIALETAHREACMLNTAYGLSLLRRAFTAFARQPTSMQWTGGPPLSSMPNLPPSWCVGLVCTNMEDLLSMDRSRVAMSSSHVSLSVLPKSAILSLDTSTWQVALHSHLDKCLYQFLFRACDTDSG